MNLHLHLITDVTKFRATILLAALSRPKFSFFFFPLQVFWLCLYSSFSDFFWANQNFF